MTHFDDNSGGSSSGLELDTSSRRPSSSSSAGNSRRAVEPPAFIEPKGARPLAGQRPVTRRPAGDDGVASAADATDSATGGAFIVIALFHVLVGLVLAFFAPRGTALPLLALASVSAVGTYVTYWITGNAARIFGVVGFVLFGGWFAFVVGMLAQLVHQLLPWLSWKILAAVAVVAALIAFGLDMR